MVGPWLDAIHPVYLPHPVNRQHPAARSRVGWWKVLAGIDGGKQLYDLMGLHHGTLTNMTSAAASGWRPTTRPGGDGHLQFDGVDDSVQMDNSAAIHSGAVTFAAWIKAASFTPAYSCVMGWDAGGIFDLLMIKSSGKLALYMTGTGVVSYDGTGSTTLVAGKWYRLVLTYDSVSGLKGYVNGALDGSAAANGALNATGGGVFALGADLGTAGRNFAGSIDDAILDSRAWSAAEVWADYDDSQRGSPGLLNRVTPRVPYLTGAAATTVSLASALASSSSLSGTLSASTALSASMAASATATATISASASLSAAMASSSSFTSSLSASASLSAAMAANAAMTLAGGTTVALASALASSAAMSGTLSMSGGSSQPGTASGIFWLGFPAMLNLGSAIIVTPPTPYRDRDIYLAIKALLIATGEFERVALGRPGYAARLSDDIGTYANIQPLSDGTTSGGCPAREFHRPSYVLTIGVRGTDDSEEIYSSRLDRLYAITRNTLLCPANRTFGGLVLSAHTKLSDGSIGASGYPGMSRTLHGEFAYELSLATSGYSTVI